MAVGVNLSTALYLVLDQGGSSSRGMVFNSRGEVLASAQQAVDTRRPQPGWVEQSPAEVVDSLRRVADDAVSQLDETGRRQLRAAGIVCQRSSLLAWDRVSGEALTPILSWQDTRADDWLARQPLDVAAIQGITGLYPNAHFGASKMRWCLDHLPGLRHREKLALAPLASYLIYALARGEQQSQPFLVDPANASRTLLMNLQTRDWEPELLHRFAIGRQWLPDIVPSLYDFGTLQAKDLSLPLKLLNGDQSAAAFAEGAPLSDCTYINIGTGAFIYRVMDVPKIQPRMLCSLLVSDGERSLFALEGTVNGAASALQWLQQHNGVETGHAPVSTDDFFREQEQLPLFLNGVGGLGSPDWCADFPTRFEGAGNPRQQALAVLESIAFLLLRNYRQLYRDAVVPRRLLVSGGLSRNDSLCQLLANLSGATVERVAQQEASARGAAYLLCEDTSRWHTAVGELFRARDDVQSCRRMQRWTELMEQGLNV